MFDCDFSWIQDTFELTVETGDDCAVFCHKTNGNRLLIQRDEYYTSDDKKETFTEYTVCFSTQHRHFGDLKEAIDYACGIFSDKTLALEFYDSDGRDRFGGDIKAGDGRSPAELMRKFGYTGQYLKGGSCVIHSWSGGSDGEIILT